MCLRGGSGPSRSNSISAAAILCVCLYVGEVLFFSFFFLLSCVPLFFSVCLSDPVRSGSPCSGRAAAAAVGDNGGLSWSREKGAEAHATRQQKKERETTERKQETQEGFVSASFVGAARGRARPRGNRREKAGFFYFFSFLSARSGASAWAWRAVARQRRPRGANPWCRQAKARRCLVRYARAPCEAAPAVGTARWRRPALARSAR